MKRLGLSLCGAMLLGAGGACLAAEPAAGTLSPASPSLSYSAGPFTTPNPTPTPGVDSGPVCDATSPCDSYRLTVSVPQDYAAAHPNLSVRVTLSWTDANPAAGSDYDLWIYEGDAGDLDGSDAGVVSSASSDNPEIAVFYPDPGTFAYTIKVVPYAPSGETVQVQIHFDESDPCAASGGATGAAVSPGVARAFKSGSADTLFGAFVHFRSGTPDAHRALLQGLGLKRVADFEKHAAAVFAVGPLAGFRALRAHPSVSYLEENKRLHYFNDTAGWATRVRVAQEGVSGGPYRAPNGEALLGQGVTVAVVDSGVNGLHPDFDGRIVHNWKITGDPILSDELVFEDVGYGDSDTTSGHGTHVAGTAVGGGEASTGDYPVPAAAPTVKGTHAGAAPAANLVAYSVGETPDPTGIAGVALLLYIDAALQHLLENYDSVTPRVRVVSLSLGDGAGSPYNPADVTSCLVKGLVAKGANVVWAAGNSGGDGSTDRTSSFCKDPTPGVLCVASYDDGGTGSITSALSSFSSRGPQGRPARYPDITAPGSNITSTCLQGVPGQYTCSFGAETSWQPYYGTISGTSMATPHVSGAIALIAQARPDLTPAQIEDAIQDYARKVGTNGPYEPDAQNAGGTTNFGFGAGLLDLAAVLDALSVSHGTPSSPGAEALVIDGDADEAILGAADVVALTMQEAAEAEGPGVLYRLTLRDAADFGASAGVVYQLRQNVNGAPFFTTVQASPGAVAVPDANGANTAIASSASLEGSVVSFFVPYAQLGHPPVGAPIHNLSVRVSDESGVLDFAPSPSGSTGGEADLWPMFALPFTVQLESGAASLGDPCVVPGIKVISDARGDVNNGLPTGQDDLVYTAIAEPGELDNRLVFTMKMDNLDPAPTNYRWITYFKAPNGTEYWVGMSNSEGVTQFNYGTSEVLEDTVRVYNVEGSLDPASNYQADGTITLVLDKAVVGLRTGDVLTGIVSSIRQSSPDSAGAAGLTVDSAAASSDYALVGNDVCRGGGSATRTTVGGSGRVGGFGLPVLLMLLGAALLRRRLY